MTLGEMKNLAMFQFNMDQEDISDFVPFIGTYINDGYDRFVKAWTSGTHIGTDEYPMLESDSDVPNIPQRFHRYIADWATWLLYRNGNSQKINRGYEYRNSFLQAVADMIGEGGKDGDENSSSYQDYKQFYNIPD